MSVPTQGRLWPIKGRDVAEPTEAEFQEAVLELAGIFRWRRVHFRPLRTKHGWQTAIIGDAGFPDLILIRGGVLLAVELKSGGRKPTPEQIAWLKSFAAVEGCRACVWTTRDPWNKIVDALRDL